MGVLSVISTHLVTVTKQTFMKDPNYCLYTTLHNTEQTHEACPKKYLTLGRENKVLYLGGYNT
jgi:hypothetical protein